MIEFTVYVRPEPQGSSKGFPVRRANGKMGVSITSSNKALKPFRHAVAQIAVLAVGNMPMPRFSSGIAVRLDIDCWFQKPKSVLKTRLYPVVRPDADKLARAILDALKGVLYADDCQVIELRVRKLYGTPERVCIKAGRPTLDTYTEDNPIIASNRQWDLDAGTPF